MKEGFFFDEYERWVKNLGIAEQDFEFFLKSFLLEQAQIAVGLAKDRTPVDTGALKASYQIGSQIITLMDDPSGRMGNRSKNKHFKVIDPENSTVDSIEVIGDTLQVVISNPMEYASYVEYGHHAYEGRYMLTIAVDTVMNAMGPRFQKQLIQFLIEKGVT